MKKLQLLIITLVIFPFFIIQAQTIFKVPKYPYETCIVDYDLDGDNDIIVGCSGPNQDPDSIVFFINDGWGNFESEKYPANINGFLYCIDLTNDGLPDIISRNAEDGIFFYENNHTISIGTTHLIKDTYGNPFIGGIADINLDGTNDIVYYDISVPWGWGVAFNNGNNTFTDSAFVESNETWQGIDVGDLNNDENPDILITTLDQSKNVKVLYNYYPEFIEQVVSTPDWSSGFILSVNDDGFSDVLLFRPLYFGSSWLVNLINEGDYFQNCDTLVFVNGTEIRNICDYNQDGYDDLSMIVYQANNQPIEDSVYIYFNDMECGYTHVQSVYMGDYAWLPTINSGDLNGDGYPDLAIQGFYTPLRESVRILWNNGTGHFIDTNSVYVRQEEIRLKQQVTVYPNPASGTLSIRSANSEVKTVEMMDLNGRIIYQKAYLPCEPKVNIDMSGKQLNPGVYVCGIYLDNGNFVFKKIILTKIK